MMHYEFRAIFQNTKLWFLLLDLKSGNTHRLGLYPNIYVYRIVWVRVSLPGSACNAKALNLAHPIKSPMHHFANCKFSRTYYSSFLRTEY